MQGYQQLMLYRGGHSFNDLGVAGSRRDMCRGVDRWESFLKLINHGEPVQPLLFDLFQAPFAVDFN